MGYVLILMRGLSPATFCIRVTCILRFIIIIIIQSFLKISAGISRVDKEVPVQKESILLVGKQTCKTAIMSSWIWRDTSKSSETANLAHSHIENIEKVLQKIRAKPQTQLPLQQSLPNCKSMDIGNCNVDILNSLLSERQRNDS